PPLVTILCQFRLPSGPGRSLDGRMARPSTIHVCSACGHETPRWAGQCPGCGEWNTLVEEARPAAGHDRRSGLRGTRGADPRAAVAPTPLAQVRAEDH